MFDATPANSTLRSMEQRLLGSGSIELTSGIAAIESVCSFLPARMPVFVPSLPKRPISENLEKLRELRHNGFEPVPHIAARRLTSQGELRNFLAVAAGEVGIQKLLLIGGDVEPPAGPYDSAEAVLRTGMLQEAGIAAVGVAAYPEPHPRISRLELERSLTEKVSLLTRHEMEPFIVTQFSLDPEMAVAICEKLEAEHPQVPLFVGIPGPTSIIKLLKYAQYCGVASSLRAVKGMGLKAARIGDRALSNQQLSAIAAYCLERQPSNVRGVHIFSFGGFRESGEWLGEWARPGEAKLDEAEGIGNQDGKQ